MPDQPNMVTAQMQLAAARQGVAASLAGGIIAASGRPHSIADALALHQAVYFALYPEPNNGRYQAWAKDREEELSRPRT